MILKILNKIQTGWQAEFKFHKSRRWRFDYANPSLKIAIEINGGVWTRGRHSRGTGQIKDFEKLNAAQMMGWRVFQYTPQQTADMVRDMESIYRIIMITSLIDSPIKMENNNDNKSNI